MIRLETLIELQISELELIELIHLSNFDKQLPVEQFEATASQSTVPSPLLNSGGVSSKFLTRESKRLRDEKVGVNKSLGRENP